MNKLLTTGLVLLLAAVANGQTPNLAAANLQKMEQSDREFLDNLEQNGAPPPIAEGPAIEAPSPAEPEMAPPPVNTPQSPEVKPNRAKQTASIKSKSNPTETRKKTSSRERASQTRERVYVGIHVDGPAILEPVERRVRTVVRPIEIRRAIPVHKPFRLFDKPLRIFDGGDDDEDEDDD